MTRKDSDQATLFSAMAGVITMDGKPAANVRLVRTVDYDKKETDETTTDELGNFEFPAVRQHIRLKFLPREFVVSQSIKAYYEGTEYELWEGVKRNASENSESRGKSLVVSCDLLSEEKHIRVDGAPYFSLCTWDVEPDPTMIDMEVH